MLKHRFARFLAVDRLHLAAHSHHLWPDVTLDAQQRAWHDAASLADDKWDLILGELLAANRGHIARHLGLSAPATIAFAPNTHELLIRLASCLRHPFRAVTTSAEFHSFRRQAARWEEAGIAAVDRVPAEPFPTFPERFTATVAAVDPHLVYLSHVFYDSGYAIPDLSRIAAAAAPGSFVVVDGYHGFLALPTHLGELEHRIFYIAGGYKYAMAGGGVCFMHCPPGYGPRPVDTGWMAGFDDLTSAGAGVGYAADGSRFFGATFDPTAWYRFDAVMRMLDEEGVAAGQIHRHVAALQARFIAGLGAGRGPFTAAALIPPWDDAQRGNFLTFRLPEAASVYDALHRRKVITDYRGDRIRLGFGVYHDEGDIDRALDIIGEL
ncbi:MAG: aminotransferase class V-fold PLP-dependent enzyme [Acidimicrobiia bacterium]